MADSGRGGWPGAGRPWWRRGAVALPEPSSRQLLSWIDQAAMGWVLLDGDDRICHISPRAERVLLAELEGGTAVGSAAARAAGVRLLGTPLARICNDPTLLSSIGLARRQERAQRLEWRYGLLDYDLAVVPGRDGWMALQLQSRRSLEAQLDQQERWVSDVAHELKTPLTALLLVGDSLAAQVTDGNARLVERLQRELRRLQDMVVNLLELSRLENAMPGQGLSFEVVELEGLMEQVWQNLRPVAEQRGVSLALQASGPPEQLRIQADQARLHRALLNLLDNALRYSPSGGVVEARIGSRGGWCQLSIRDQGPGLSEDDLNHMFERFYRGDSSRVRQERTGSGLGLAIVQQIAATHGGRVQARNHGDGGALLELILPQEPAGLSAR
ncbi:cell wall metabolism sensor histidine kinase WalK [Cyanobium sp. LEGE 06143]|uniref:sensor histidine kinase n=1 Tax=Cyanobium sp. LEGE 06143 TaxID=945727 RepID=UPI001D13AC30|nr:HAMP domain-containing sensor histidine kinase [Cyanobium sp. LEGE 06143]